MLPQMEIHHCADLLQARPPLSADLLAPSRRVLAWGPKSFSCCDYRDLLIAAHQQLDGPIVLVAALHAHWSVHPRPLGASGGPTGPSRRRGDRGS